MNYQQKNRRFFVEKKKKKANQPKGIFVEVYTVAPAPSRDYYALQLFQKKFSWTKWKICHGPYVAPIQKVVSLEDFKKDATLQHELTYIFGQDTTNLISDLANEKWSLTSMPSNVLLKVFSYLSVSDILRLSQVCKRLSKECSSNELWKSICKKQWKILIHSDIEKAGLIGWKTVYLEKMRPKRYKIESGHHPKPNFSHRNRILSVSTLNTPDSRASLAKSGFAVPKRVQELKKFDSVRKSSSEISGNNRFNANSIGTGKSTERTIQLTDKGNRRNENQAGGEKLPLTPHLRQASARSDASLAVFPASIAPAEKQKEIESNRRRTKKNSPRGNKCKSISTRTRSATAQSVQPNSTARTKSRGERA